MTTQGSPVSENTRQRASAWWAAPLFLGIAVVWLAFWWALHDDPQRGSFGDMFGALNAIFSGLAFAGLIVAIFLQSQELRLQRYELEQTRRELEGQRLALEAQGNTLAKQNFENAFFQLLRFHNDIVNAIDLTSVKTSGVVVTRGRDCIEIFYGRLKNAWERWTAADLAAGARTSERDRLRAAYDEFFRAHQNEIGHYFRNLYHLFKFIDESDVAEKHRYASLARAQLSSFELALLFYNCLSRYGEEKFLPLAQRYSLFENLSPQLLLKADHAKQFSPEAFGDAYHEFTGAR